MRRPGPSRLPGDPAATDRDFGPLGGLVDDVVYWEADLERSRELEMRRFEEAARSQPDRVTPSGHGPAAAGGSALRRLLHRAR